LLQPELLFLAQNAPEIAWRPGSASASSPRPLAAVKGFGPREGRGKRRRREGGKGRNLAAMFLK